MKGLRGITVIFVIALFSTTCFGGDLCWVKGDLKVCEWGCCGDYSTDTLSGVCCEDTNIGVIVGAVIGSIALVTGIVVTIVVVCCCCRKQPIVSGHVIQGNTATVVTGQTLYGVPNVTNVYDGPDGQVQMTFTSNTTPVGKY
ncbi:uncharacterized protein LOC128207219 [Mya arenaria]|uniref:uncharacterized protein LOC128207219 n=1 Tax=Mya arenaria TaxID=6604 RepID=UPI0022E6D5AE|nr:uncharacterized protein LOC128207219 [Mya arenaria]